MTLRALPGADLVEKGLRDLERRTESVESLLVSLSAPRLRALGLVVPEPWADPELRLYRMLAAQYGAGGEVPRHPWDVVHTHHAAKAVPMYLEIMESVAGQCERCTGGIGPRKAHPQ